MENRYIKGSEPVLTKAGDHRVKLGVMKHSPKVDCRVVAEEYYQSMLEEIEYWQDRYEATAIHKINLSKMNEKLTQRLIDAGLQQPAVRIDQSHG